MLNHIALLGRLTDNPEVRTVGAGTNRATFTLAVNRDFKSKDTNEYEADFIDIVAWRSTADFVGKYFTKGLLVCVEGRLQIESYTDREGIRRRAAKVQASQVHFAESRRDSAPNYGNQGFNPPPTQPMAPQHGAYPAGNGYTPPPQGGYSPPSAGGYSVPTTPPPQQQGEQGKPFHTLRKEEEDENFPF